MAVQQNKKSRSRRDMRRSHDALCAPTLSVDPVTGETHRRHHVTADGYYRGRQVIQKADQVFEDFKRSAQRVRRGKFKGETEYEISFDNKADFNRFVRNIPVLSAIIAFKPRSVYELAKLTEADVSNLNKTIQFFEDIGVIRIKTANVDGRTVKQPHVEYDEVTFRLAS